jgi:putative aldouronate transport system substrate-binding protein
MTVHGRSYRAVLLIMLAGLLLPLLAACGSDTPTATGVPAAPPTNTTAAPAAATDTPAMQAQPTNTTAAAPGATATTSSGSAGAVDLNQPAACANVTAGMQGKKLRILSNVVGGKTPEENDLFVKELERLTGADIDFVKPASDYDQKLLADVSAGTAYDLIYMTKPTMDILVDQKVLTPLTDKIKASPVLGDPKVIPPAEWDIIRYGDGQIYSVYQKFEGGTMPIVRQDWMEKLHLQEPKTLDDFYNVLKAFKEQDPDGNGKADTYGLSTSGLYDIQGFMSAAGVKSHYVIDANGKRSIPFATDAAIPVYEWLAKLYKEGILDPNFATNSTSQMRELFLADRVGMITYWDAWVGLLNNTRMTKDPNTTFRAKGIAGATGPDGKIMLRRGDPSVFAIPVNAPDPDAAFKFLEFWNCPAGILLGSLGIEGNDYTVQDGKYTLTKTGQDHGMDHGVPRWYNSYFPRPLPLPPGVVEAQKIILDNNATIEIPTAQWTDANKIINDYAFKAINGQMPVADAVHQMHDELKAKNLIDN